MKIEELFVLASPYSRLVGPLGGRVLALDPIFGALRRPSLYPEGYLQLSRGGVAEGRRQAPTMKGSPAYYILLATFQSIILFLSPVTAFCPSGEVFRSVPLWYPRMSEQYDTRIRFSVAHCGFGVKKLHIGMITTAGDADCATDRFDTP